MDLYKDKKALMMSCPAWLGQLWEPSAGDWADLCPIFASLPVSWGMLNPANGIHPPKAALCLPKDQWIGKTT